MSKKSCPQCSSTNTEYKLVTEYQEKKKKRSLIMWILFWWWFEILLWIFLTIPRMLIALFFPKRKELHTSSKSIFFCQDCGYQGI